MKSVLPWLCLLVIAGCQRSVENDLVSEAGPAVSIEGVPDSLFSKEVNRRVLPPICNDDQLQLIDTIGIVNDTDAVVEVDGIGKSCSCTATHVDPKPISRGERLEIAAKPNLPRESGPWSYTLTVKSKDGRATQITTSIFVYHTLECEKDAINLTNLKPGEAHKSIVKFTAHRPPGTPARTLEVRAEQGRMTATQQGPTTDAVHGVARDVYEVELGMTPEVAGSEGEDRLLVSLAGESNRAAPLTVPVRWRAATPYSVVPTRAFLVVRPTATKAVSQTLIIKCQHGAFTPSLRSGSEIPAGVSVAFRQATDPATWLADVTADPTQLAPGTRRLELPIATGRSDEPAFHLPVTLFRD